MFVKYCTERQFWNLEYRGKKLSSSFSRCSCSQGQILVGNLKLSSKTAKWPSTMKIAVEKSCPNCIVPGYVKRSLHLSRLNIWRSKQSVGINTTASVKFWLEKGLAGRQTVRQTLQEDRHADKKRNVVHFEGKSTKWICRETGYGKVISK